MKTADIASAPAETWNQKNLPSDIERYEESPDGVISMLRKLPSAAKALVQERPGIVVLSLTALGAIALAWYFATRD